jgi:hypothetical protein
MPFGLFSLKGFYIIWLSNLSSASVPDEGCSRNVSSPLNSMYMYLFVLFRNMGLWQKKKRKKKEKNGKEIAS